MNRTIKFRGKDINTGEWLYGNLIQRIGRYPGIVFSYEHGGKIHYCEQPIDSDTSGQFTGNYDKNGDEIFDGDILVSKCSGVAVGYLEVFWSDDKAAFLVEDYNDDRQTSGNLYYLSEFDTKDYTICGNKHDNPDLLKGE